MAGPQEEVLTLRVVLEDNATPGLVALRQNIAQLTSGSAAANIDRFKRDQQDMTRQVKDLTTALISGEKAMVSFIGKSAGVGAALVAGGAAMRSFSERMGDIVRLGERLGVPAANIKNVVAQLAQVGVSGADARETIANLTHTLVELGRVGSASHAELIKNATGYIDQMEAFIKRAENASTIEEKLNTVMEAGRNVRANRYREARELGQSESQAQADAAYQEEKFYEQLHLRHDILIRMHNQFKYMTDEQRQRYDTQLRQGDEIEKQYYQIDTALQQAGNSLLINFGPTAVTMLGLVPPVVEAIATSFGSVNREVDEIAKAYEKGDWQAFFFGRKGTGGISDYLGSDVKPGQPGQPGQAGQPSIPQLQHGGIVTRPTLAMIGEHGPEAVVPLSAMPGALLGGSQKSDDNQKSVKDNTDQLKRLNDFLALLETGDIKLKMGTGVGGTGGDGTGGDGTSGGRTGGDGSGGRTGGDGTGDGTATDGGDKLKRRLGGWTQTGGAPGGGTFPKMTGTGAERTSAGAAETAPTGGRRRLGGAAGGLGTLAQQRAGFMKELNDDPQLKNLAIGAMSKEGGIQSNLEQLFNYASMRGMTIRQALYSGQYGPVTGRNKFSTQALIAAGAAAGKGGQEALAAVGGGSNITDYATDQGMAGDPNYAKYMANRDYYNMHKVQGAWFSYHGERGRKWAQEQRAAAAASGNAPVVADQNRGKRSLTHATEASRNDGKDLPAQVLEEAAGLVRGGGNQAQLKKFIESQVDPNTGKHYTVHDAWCGDFAAAVITKAGGTPPKNPAWAMNWHEYGQHAEVPAPGDVITRWNLRGAHGHVAVVKAYDPKTGMVTIEQGNTNAVYDLPLDRVKREYEIRHGELRKEKPPPPPETPYEPGAVAASRRAAIEAATARPSATTSTTAPALSQHEKDIAEAQARGEHDDEFGPRAPGGTPLKFLPEQARKAAEAELARKAVDDSSKKTVKVEGTAKVDVKVADASAHPVGIRQRNFFKPNPPEHKAQMVPAETGAPRQSDAAATSHAAQQ